VFVADFGPATMIADKAAQANLLGGMPLTASAQALIEEPPLARKLGAPISTPAPVDITKT
jgi:hypothetical protein